MREPLYPVYDSGRTRVRLTGTGFYIFEPKHCETICGLALLHEKPKVKGYGRDAIFAQLALIILFIIFDIIFFLASISLFLSLLGRWGSFW